MFPQQILVSPTARRAAAAALAIASLVACGQKGPLFLPASDAGRATLTQTLSPAAAAASAPASAPAATGTASPVRTP